jgi:polysaccharide export outer membrane protein
MKNLIVIFLSISCMFSCSTKRDILYFQDSDKYHLEKVGQWNTPSLIQINDILKISIVTEIEEVDNLYNSISNKALSSDINLLQLNGYLVDKDYNINIARIGKINTKNKTLSELEVFIEDKLMNEKLLNNASVSVRFLNSKFTVLGEVNTPGTYGFYDNSISLLQAIGYAGDLNSYAKRKRITVIREQNGVRKIRDLDITKANFLNDPYCQIKNNDVIIIHPNFNKVKSSGFIGSPQSISSIASILLSISLIILNQ